MKLKPGFYYAEEDDSIILLDIKERKRTRGGQYIYTMTLESFEFCEEFNQLVPYLDYPEAKLLLLE